MSKADLKQLIAQGRFSVTDQVSVNEGPWRPISEFLVGAAAIPSVATSQPIPPVRNLRVLSGEKIYGPMSRDQIKQLVTEGRLKTNDLICAIDGPWMPLADFFPPAPQGDLHQTAVSPSPASPSPARPTAVPLAAAPLAATSPTAIPRQAPPPVPASSGGTPVSLPQPAPVVDASEEELVELTLADIVEDMPIEEPKLPQLFPLSSSSLLDALEPEEPALSTKPEWFVKIRGMPSSHLTMLHLKSLVIAREIHAETPTAHMSWDERDWRPFRAVRELAGLLKFLPT
jgi:hypothetical protein